MKKTLANVFPHLIKEWDFNKNGDLTPSDVPPKGRKVVWWICEKRHSYQAKIAHKSNGKQCPDCTLYSRSLTVRAPFALKYWDYEKNTVSPDKVSYGSNKIYWWKCENGHSFDTSAKAITRKNRGGCPYCRGLRVNDCNSLATHYPYLISEWVICVDDPELTPETVTPGGHKEVKWKCNKGHEWITSIKHRTLGNTNCPECNKGRRISKPSYILYYYLKQEFDDTTLEYPIEDSRLILDILIPSQQTAIEYDGGIYHKQIERDINKEKLLLEKMPTIRLIRIREPDCGVYQSPNNNVIKHPLPDHKVESLQQCLELIFKEVFKVNKDIDIQKDNIDILKLMSLTEIKMSLGALHPNLVKEWDTQKNKGLTPFQFKTASHEKVYWKCAKYHSWLATIASRSHGGNNCPECGSRKLNAENNLAAKFPKLISEWHYEKNDKQPQDYFAYSHFPVWWICSYCNHEWEATITNRTSRNSGCPVCALNKK